MNRWTLIFKGRSWGPLYFKRALPNSIEFTSYEASAHHFESEEEANQTAKSLGITHKVTATEEAGVLVATD